MGCDGGTIPKRDELVRLKKKPEQKDKDMDLFVKWCLCTISQEPLNQPIVACELGRLYNKESILEYLLDKSICQNAQHIRGLKDVTVLNLTTNPVYGNDKVADKGDAYIDRQKSKYICPVSGLEMNGRHRFCFLPSCGCVFSERALKEVKSTVCNKCGGAYSKGDEIVLNGSDDDVAALTARMEDKRAKARAAKKAKKGGKHKLDKSSTSQDTPSTSNGPTSSKLPRTDQPGTSKSLTNGDDKPSKSKSVSTNGKSATVNGDGKISYDPKKSEAYKSLFVDPEKEKNKEKPHWVTFNPYY
ncbi:replication termination factor 2-like [Saccoglossus kowalevskii]|uniref:Replication termination factor 2 n=1 Tax=Saccoglossus kowalevskii TaxID=10224 RepID=A0ABM0GUG2_SACKO|nr:PREDICTED: protein RTF2 homolog [Saccoglossus kowalevskii]